MKRIFSILLLVLTIVMSSVAMEIDGSIYFYRGGDMPRYLKVNSSTDIVISDNGSEYKSTKSEVRVLDVYLHSDLREVDFSQCQSGNLYFDNGTAFLKVGSDSSFVNLKIKDIHQRFVEFEYSEDDGWYSEGVIVLTGDGTNLVYLFGHSHLFYLSKSGEYLVKYTRCLNDFGLENADMTTLSTILRLTASGTIRNEENPARLYMGKRYVELREDCLSENFAKAVRDLFEDNVNDINAELGTTVTPYKAKKEAPKQNKEWVITDKQVKQMQAAFDRSVNKNIRANTGRDGIHTWRCSRCGAQVKAKAPNRGVRCPRAVNKINSSHNWQRLD